MTDFSLACEPIVSIQRVPATDAVSGHISWGALVAPDLVVVPGPVGPVLEAGPFEVLLASASPLGAATTGSVERLRPRFAEAVGTPTSPDGAILALWLSHRSQHMPSGRALDAEELAATVDEESDLWTALEALGAVPDGIRELSPSQVLETVDTWERATWREIVTVTPLLLATGGEVAIRWCRWRPCNCPGPWWNP